MIALVTDSGAQLPVELQRRHGVRVVPISVVVDGVPYREGVDIDARSFYDRMRQSAVVSTAAPSPGDLLDLYETAARDGATAVVSVHVGSNASATVQNARLAANLASVPVEIVDTGRASFEVGCCVIAAAEALHAGGDAAHAVAAAERVARAVRDVFVAGDLERARRGGRLSPTTPIPQGVNVLALEDGKIVPLATVTTLGEGVDEMVRHVTFAAESARLRVAVGDADAHELADALESKLRGVSGVADIIRYQVGPSVAAHTGTGTVGAVFHGLPEDE